MFEPPEDTKEWRFETRESGLSLNNIADVAGSAVRHRAFHVDYLIFSFQRCWPQAAGRRALGTGFLSVELLGPFPTLSFVSVGYLCYRR